MKEKTTTLLTEPKNELETKELVAQINQLSQIITQAEEAIKNAAERLNELFEILAKKNIKENPYAADLRNSFTLPVSKKIKKEEDPLLRDHLKGRFRSFAKVYHSISKRY